MKINKEEDDLLKQIATRLPVINVHSSEKHRLKGSEIIEWETVTEIDGKAINPDKWYIWNYPVITEMNHYKRLKNIWKDRSPERKMQAVFDYMKYIETVVTRHLKENNISIEESKPILSKPTADTLQPTNVNNENKNRFKNILKILRGRMRLFFGFCPKCNSDAPELYDCKVCNWYSTSQHGMPSKELKSEWWKKFKSTINNEAIKETL